MWFGWLLLQLNVYTRPSIVYSALGTPTTFFSWRFSFLSFYTRMNVYFILTFLNIIIFVSFFWSSFILLQFNSNAQEQLRNWLNSYMYNMTKMYIFVSLYLSLLLKGVCFSYTTIFNTCDRKNMLCVKKTDNVTFYVQPQKFSFCYTTYLTYFWFDFFFVFLSFLVCSILVCILFEVFENIVKVHIFPFVHECFCTFV